MSFDDLVKDIADVMPRFNSHALRDFVAENIDSSADFPALVFTEGFKITNADLELVSHTIMSPIERAKFELRVGRESKQRPKIPLTVSHLQLVNYRTRFGEHYIDTKLYVPYMVDDMLYINDRRSMPRKVILEKTVSRVKNNDKDGLSVSPIRVNLLFNRRRIFSIESYTSKERYNHFIVGAKLFHGSIASKICDTNVSHYMLAKFGFVRTLKRFGLSFTDIFFTQDIGDDTDDFEYFYAKKNTAAASHDDRLFLKVRRSLLQDDQALKFVVNLMYVLSFFDIQNIENVYVEEQSIWKIILGIVLFGEHTALKALSNATTNLKSADYFIDSITAARFERFGLPVKDTYDLLVYIFQTIDHHMVNSKTQDIYNSRFDVINGILVETFARRTFINFYTLARRNNVTLRDVETALNLNAMMFRNSSSGKRDDSEHYIAPPDIIGDNWLFAGGLNKIRLGGKAEQRFHPSMVVVESVNAFVGKHIGKTGYMNPYVPTDEHGAIVHPDYAKDIDSISVFLPK